VTYSSIQLGLDNKPVSDAHSTLNDHVNSQGITPDSKGAYGITTKVGNQHQSFQAGGPAAHAISTRVQLRDPGPATAKVGGFSTDPKSAETLAAQAPHLPNSTVETTATSTPAQERADPRSGTKAAPEAAPYTSGEDEFPVTNEVGKHALDTVKGVGISAIAPVLVAAFNGRQDMTTQAIGRFAAQAGLEPDVAAGYLHIVNMELTKQVNALAATAGVEDMDHMNAWLQRNYRDTAASVTVRHLTTGNTRASWGPLIDAYVASHGITKRR
jgi:hypothetical protein